VSSTSCLLGPEKLKTNEEVILAKGGFLNKWTAKPKTNALSGVKVVMAPKKDEEEDEFEIDFGDAKPKLQMPAALKKTTGNYLMGMKPDIAKAQETKKRSYDEAMKKPTSKPLNSGGMATFLNKKRKLNY